ncbi:MAG: hypothetical protein QOE23_3371, partial [Pseudonocardiales bacterium]|nr:hypothetical protein [Pseudonocardiales bacterium]
MARSVATGTELLRRAGIQARLAPSVHNTQPWRFVLTDDALEIHSDPRRQLLVLDPTGRQLAPSCGCAVFNARVAVAARGHLAWVERLPDPDRPHLLARITVAPEPAAEQSIAALDEAIIRRQTNRRRFAEEALSPELVARLTEAVEQEESMLFEVRKTDHRLAVARLSQQAERIQNADPAYRAELRTWTTEDPMRPDGVPAVAVPHVTGASRDEVPIRDFDTRGAGALPSETRSRLDQALFVLGTPGDDGLSWIRAGEALERLWLEATEQGYVASLFTQVIEVPHLRDRLRSELELGM